jgi:hypothetical protein
LQPISKSDALAYLKAALLGTIAKNPEDDGLEPGVMRDANNNAPQRITYSRDADEQHLF